jgi:hypothetical protein
MIYGIARRITPKKSGETLDGIAARIKQQKQPAHWRPGNELSYGIYQLMEEAIEDDDTPRPERAWSWLKLMEDERGYSLERKRPIHDWLTQNPGLRREIQKIAFSDESNNDDPWMAIVHDLPTANRALALSMADAVEILTELGSKDILGNLDIALWAAIIRSQQRTEGIPEEIQTSADVGINRHSVLEQEWKVITSPPKQDWKKGEKKRREYREHKQARRFKQHRDNFLPIKEKIASGEEIGALKQIASAYLGRYYDLDREAQPDGRVRQWLGDELASAALGGFVRALSRNDMPSAQQIAETHVEGKEWNVEAVLLSGIAELVRSGKSLTTISRPILTSALAAWWEFPDINSNRLGEHIQERLEDLVFSSEQEIEAFLCSVVEPRIRSGLQHVPALYRLAREDRFSLVAGRLALKWLRAHPNINSFVQLELFQIAAEHAQSSDVRAMVRERLSKLHREDVATRLMWMSAAFLSDFDECKETLTKFFNNDKDYLWSLREMVRPERHERRALKPSSIQQLEFVILTFAEKWPPVPHPSGSWGDTHPWNATEFIGSCIDALSANPSEAASTSLERIASALAGRAYSDRINHARAQQMRLRRDTEFRVPTFNEVKQTLSNGLPGSIDDLKAMTIDRLELVQDYLRNSDTKAWEAFWGKDKPKNENTCRDRLLDQLRPRLPVEINFLPEISMPEANRADIVVIYRGFGVPVEIKGQWHSEVWNAASVQLIEKYARDWRADDRGIYVVMWFGDVPGKNLPKHPDSLSRPSSPNELREMLVARLKSTERTSVDVFVLDVSKPKLK